MASVQKIYLLRQSNPTWLADMKSAIEAVPDSVFFDQNGKPIKNEVRQFDAEISRELRRRFGSVTQDAPLWRSGLQFRVDMVLPTSPRTLVEIEKGQLPRLELDIIKIMSIILSNPEEYSYGCLVVPVNYIEPKLRRKNTTYQYLTGGLLPLARPLLDICNSEGYKLLKEFCVIGYWDPRDSGNVTKEGSSERAQLLQRHGMYRPESLVCDSKHYEGRPYLYWWDIGPSKRERLRELGRIVFRKKDSGEECVVRGEDLLPFLTPERQTTRGTHNWGIRVLLNRPDYLAIEPRSQKHGDWVYIPVEWH